MLHRHMTAMPLSLCLEIDIVSSDTINAGKEDLRRWEERGGGGGGGEKEGESDVTWNGNKGACMSFWMNFLFLSFSLGVGTPRITVW